MIRNTLVAILFLCASPAFAHALNLFVRDEGDAVKGNAYFTGGVPARI